MLDRSPYRIPAASDECGSGNTSESARPNRDRTSIIADRSQLPFPWLITFVRGKLISEATPRLAR